MSGGGGASGFVHFSLCFEGPSGFLGTWRDSSADHGGDRNIKCSFRGCFDGATAWQRIRSESRDLLPGATGSAAGFAASSQLRGMERIHSADGSTEENSKTTGEPGKSKHDVAFLQRGGKRVLVVNNMGRLPYVCDVFGTTGGDVFYLHGGAGYGARTDRRYGDGDWGVARAPAEVSLLHPRAETQVHTRRVHLGEGATDVQTGSTRGPLQVEATALPSFV